MIEKLIELTTDLSLDIVKSSIKDMHDLRKIRNDIVEFVQARQELILIDDNNEIDYQGYLDYIRTDMLDNIKWYICTVDYEEAKNIKRMILAKASVYERNKGYNGGSIQFITENCINVVKEYYKGKLDGNCQLLAHITVQSIVDSIVPKIDVIDGKVEKIENIVEKQEENRKADSVQLYQELTEIKDMISNGSRENKEMHINGFFLAYYEQDASVINLKVWLDSNSIKYDSYCYMDEYTEENDVIRHLGMKQVLILLIGERFLRNIHCVYGLAELTKNKACDGWILPVVVDKSIFSTEKRTQCIDYWETKERELRTAVDGLEKVQHAYNLVSDELIKYEKTAQSIDEFIVWVTKHSYNMDTIKEVIKKKNKFIGELESNLEFREMFSKTAKRQYIELTQVGNKFHNLNIVTEIFPEASICDLEFSGINEKSEKLLLMEFIEQYDSESLMLLGDGGMGKTTLLFHILESYYNCTAKFSQIPLYIELNRCPSNLDSWCLDDKDSVFVEKYIAGLLKNEKDINKTDQLIKDIQHEFQKEPILGKPRYLILLDGLNEVAAGNSNGYSVRAVLENEITHSIQKYKNVRFVITSRNNSGQIKGIKKIDISGISKESIEAYLREEEKKGDIRNGITDEVLRNRALLRCLRIPLFLNMFGVISGDTVITTRGEILREFFYKKRASLYSNKIEGDKISGFILDFIIPEIAWEMVSNDTFAISFKSVREIERKVLTDSKESVALNEYSQKCFNLYEPPSYFCSVLLSEYNEEQRTKGLIDIMVESLAIIYVDDGEYKFRHHHFRDYFAALHIIHEMKLGVHMFDELGFEGNYLNNIKKHRLQKNIIQFISESIGLHHSNPRYISNKGWTRREWNQENEIMLRVLDAFRGRFDCDIGYSLWNIVQILNFSGMGLLGMDMSDLNLQNINFNGILCGIGLDLAENATIFNNSIIDLNYFLPISHHEIVTDVKYSDNGQYILTISSTKMIIWNSVYEYINKFEVNKKINKAIFSKDSNYIIYYTEDLEIRVWDLWKDKNFIVNDNQEEICDLCSGDTSQSVFVAYRSGEIKRFNLRKQRWIGRTLRVGQDIDQILYNKKYGQIVVKTRNGNVLYVNECSGNVSNPFISNVKYMAQTEAGEKFGIITMDNYVKVGDLHEGQLKIISHNNKNVSRLQLSSDGKYFAFVGDKSTLQIFDLDTHKFKRPLQCTGEITALSFSDDNKYIISSAQDSFARIWEIKSNVGVCIRPLGDIADWIRNAYYSPDGAYIATSSIDCTGKIWDAKKGTLIKLLYEHENRVTSISFDNTGEKVVTTSDDCTAKIWEVKAAGCIKTLKSNDNSVHNAVFDESGEKLVTVSWDKTGTIWDLWGEDRPYKRLIGHSAPVHTVLFDASYNNLITSSNDTTAIVWNAKTGEETGIKVAHSDRLNSAAFSPDGKYIITSSFDKTAKVWTREGEFIKSLEGHRDSVRSALFSPDGKHIVTVSRDTTGKLWDGHTFLWRKDLIGHTFFVRSAMFDKQGRKIVTASYDGSVREWDLDGKCINILHSIPGLFVCGCDFRHLNSQCHITQEQREFFSTHGAIVN